MGKRYDIVFIVFMCLGVFNLLSCSKGDFYPEREEAYVTLRANFSSASQDVNVLGAAEYAFRSVRMYAFDGNKLDTMVYRSLKNVTELDTIRAHVTQTSDKTLYVIANEPVSMYETLNRVATPAQLSGIEYQIADYMEKEAFNTDASFGAEAFSVPMFGSVKNISTIQRMEGDIEVSVALTRALVRVDVYLQREESSDDMARVTVDGSTTLSIRNTYGSGYLLPDQLAKGELIDKEDIVSGPGSAVEVPEQIGEGRSAARRFFSFYTPEYDCSERTLGFDLRGVMITNGSGTNRRNFEVTLMEGETPLKKIERNHVYKVYATFASIGDGKIQLQPEITITDWINAADTATILRPKPVPVN